MEIRADMTKRRLARWVLIPAIVFISIVAVLRSALVERPVARLMEAGIEIVTGEQVVVGALSIEPLTQTIHVSGLIMSHEAEDGTRSPVLAAQRVSVRLGIPLGGAWVRNLEVVRPVVHLHIDDDGLREFRSMSVGESTSDDLPWNRIHLKNARVEVDSPMGLVLLEGVDVQTVQGDKVDMGVDTVRFQIRGFDEVARKVAWKGVTLTPQRLTVPDLRIESQHIHLQGDVDAQFGGVLSGNMSASVALAILDGPTDDEQYFEGTAHLDVELAGQVRDPIVQGALLVSSLKYYEQASAQPVEVERLLAQVEWHGRMLAIEGAETSWADGRVYTRGTVDLVSSGVDLSTNFEGIDLRSAIREAGGHTNSWTTFLGDGDLQVAGTIRPFRLAGTYTIGVHDLDVGSGLPGAPTTTPILSIPEIQLDGYLDVDAEGIWLHNQKVKAGGTSGSIDAFIGFNPHGPLDIDFDLNRTSLSTFRPLLGLDLWGFGALNGAVKGPFDDLRFTANGTLNDFHMLGAPLADEISTRFVCNDLKNLEFQEFKGRLGETHYMGQVDVLLDDDTSMNLGMEITEGRVQDLLRISGADLSWVTGQISGILNLSGDPENLDGDFDMELRDVELLGEQFPAGSVSGWLTHGQMNLDHLALERWSGEEGVLARGTVGADWSANLDLTATGFQLERLNHLQRVKLPMKGLLSIDAVIQGSVLDPHPEGRVALREASYGDYSLPPSTVNFHTEADQILVEGNVVGQGLQFTGAIERAGKSAYSLDVSLEQFPLHSLYPTGADGTDVTALLSGAVQLDGQLAGQPSVDMLGRGRTLELSWDRHRLHTLAPWDFELSGRAMRLSGFRIQGAGTDLEWDVMTDSDGSISGAGGGIVDADLARLVVDGLERADGTVALNLGVGGKLGAADWSIDAALCGATIQGDWFPHPFEALQGVLDIRADGTEIRALEPEGRDASWVARTEFLQPCVNSLTRSGITGRLGDGDMSLRGGFTADGWWPTQFDLEGDVRSARVQFIDELPPISGDARLQLDGPAEELLLAGTIEVSEMVFSDRISWEEWLLELSEADATSMELNDDEPWFSMDIGLHSDNTIRMRNNVADFKAGGELRVVGDTNQPGLVGSVRAVSGGRVYLKEREFEVQRAEIHFVDPFSFDPDIDLLLTTDVRSREEQFEVTYRVGGTYADWRAETRSEPSLPAADVNALLLFGMTRAEMERYGGLGGALAVEGGDLLASSVLFTGRSDTERGGLFRIVDPLRPERFDLVSGVSERGSGAVSSDLRLLYENDLSDVGLPGSLMIFEQNISRASDTYLGFEQRLARTLYARSYWGSEQVGRYLELGGAYGVEMKVRWELD
jgi:hypothetical protein